MSSILNLSSVPEIGIPSGRTHGSRKHHNWKLNLLSYQRERESERERERGERYLLANCLETVTCLQAATAPAANLQRRSSSSSEESPRLAAIWAPLTSHNTGFFGKPTNPPKDYYCTTYKHFVIAVCVGPKFRWRLRRGALPA